MALSDRITRIHVNFYEPGRVSARAAQVMITERRKRNDLVTFAVNVKSKTKIAHNLPAAAIVASEMIQDAVKSHGRAGTYTFSTDVGVWTMHVRQASRAIEGVSVESFVGQFFKTQTHDNTIIGPFVDARQTLGVALYRVLIAVRNNIAISN